jgi:PAS domain S-box-containing protein
LAKSIHILILEDSRGDVLLIKHQLLQAELDFILEQVETRESFEEALHSFQPDIILADYTLPTYDGFQALIKANETCPEVPFIFVTGTLSVEFAVKTLKQGAKDFVLKDQLSKLGQVVKRALEEKEALEKRKEIEEDLHTFQRLFNLSLDLLCIMDFDGYFQKINPVFEDTFGYLKEEIIGKKLIDFVHEKDLEKTLLSLEEQRKGSLVLEFENRFRCKNGEYKWLSWASRPDVNRGILYGAARDITNQKQVEMDLRIKDRAIKSSSNGLIITDPTKDNHPIIYCNPAFEKITGYEQEEVKGRGCWFLLNEDFDQEGFREIRDAMFEGRRCKVVVRNYKKDGSLFYNEVRVSPIRNKKEQITHFVCIFNDITDRLLADQELRDSYQTIEAHVRELEQFAYITSHNLRAPVANIQGLVEIYQAGNLDEDTIHILNQNLQKSADALDRIITDLNSILEIKQTSPDQYQKIDLQELLTEVIRRNEEDIQVSGADIRFHFQARYINAILPYTRSIFNNLIENAIKYRDLERSPVIRIKSWTENDSTCISIEDNGIGIDLEQNKDALFGLYKRFHFHVKGKGMGLHMVKNQIEAMGGSIRVESEPGRGTKFVIQIPERKMGVNSLPPVNIQSGKIL